jgi:hypothetical protein
MGVGSNGALTQLPTFVFQIAPTLLTAPSNLPNQQRSIQRNLTTGCWDSHTYW